MKAILLAVILSLSVGAVAGVVVSRAYWGYYTDRPDVPREILQAQQLRFVTPLRPVGKGSACTLAIDPEYSVQERMQWAVDDPYYAHEGRLLLELAQRGLSPAAAPRDEELPASEVFRDLRKAHVVVPGDIGYEFGTCLSGVAVEVVDDTGQSALVLGLHGQQVSNDHFPYYEAWFRSDGSNWRLEGAHRYFYDVAGIEGLEGPVLSLVFAILFFAATSGAAITYSAARRLAAVVRRRRTKR